MICDGSSASSGVINRFLNAIRVIAAVTQPDLAAEKIVSECSKLLDCETAFLFAVDDDSNQLVLFTKSIKAARLFDFYCGCLVGWFV